MINIKNEAEIAIMQEAGRIAAAILQATLARAVPGTTTKSLNDFAEKQIIATGAMPSFKGYQGYPFATCINVNEGVVHGFPGSYELKRGDLLSIDLGVYYRGFHADTSWTVLVEADQVIRGSRRRFLNAGKKALRQAVDVCRPGGRVGDISQEIQTVIEQAGFNVVRDLVGHGVGRELHEEPSVPGFGQRGQGPVLKVGMVLAIEVIYTEGSYNLTTEADGWTIRTVDGKLSGLFEHTVAVTNSGPIVLTSWEETVKLVEP